MAAWQGWRTSTSETDRRLRVGRLGDAERAGLERLTDNLERAGESRAWFVFDRRHTGISNSVCIRPEVLERLLDGLEVQERAFPDFCRAVCNWGTPGVPL